MGLFGKKENTARTLPRHIAIVMDGNGRWAKKRGLPRSAGHVAGAKTFKTIARYCNKIGLENLTVYAFSTENWKRPKEEVDGIMNLLRDYLKDAENFKDENIKVRFLGDRTPLADDIKALMLKNEDGSKDATGLNLNIAINYGGRSEIVSALNEFVRENPGKEITEEDISARLYFRGQPDPDLIIRTGGEMRLSNFMLWEAAYSEFYSTQTFWPDFTPEEFDKAVEAFGKRTRRFGGV